MDQPITTTEELEAAMQALARERGTPADFEAAVTALAERIERPSSHRTLVRLARLGATSYPGPADVPCDGLAEFQGRPWADLPTVPRRSDGTGPRREQEPGESLPSYMGYLGEALFAHLGLGDEDTGTPMGLAAMGYLSMLVVPDLRRLVGWERSLDAHALGMLTAERALRHLGEARMPPDQEEACFRWLHLACWEEITPEHVAEAAARREVRLAHQREPAGAVAVMTCEVPVPDALDFHEKVASVPSTAFGLDQLRAWLDRAASTAEDPRRWELRREGFGHLGRLDLTAAAVVEGPDHAAYVHGHLMRWLVEHEVPFRTHMLALTTSYAFAITRALVRLPAEGADEISPLAAHMRAVRVLRAANMVPLADELAVLAWLMDQREFGIRLAPYLEARRQQLARSRGG